MKDYRVIQVSFDVVVDCDCDGTILAENLAEELEGVGYEVVGAGFQADVTESYKQQNQGVIGKFKSKCQSEKRIYNWKIIYKGD